MNSMIDRIGIIGLLLSTAISSSAEEIVVKAAKVYTQAGKPLSPGTVHVKDGKTVAVAAAMDVPAGAKLVDLGSGVLIPGLIDAFASIGVEGGAAESTVEISPNFRVLDAIDWSSKSFRQARSEGVTAAAIVPGADNVVAGLSSVVKTAGAKSKRVVKADHSLVIVLASDPTSGNNSRNRPDSIYNRQPTNRMGVVWLLRHECATAARSKGGPLSDALAGKRPVICLSRSDVDIVAALRLNKDYPMALSIAGGQEAYKVRGELAAAKTPVLLGPLDTAAANGPEGTETVLNVAGALRDAGVPIALTGGKLLDQARFAARFGLPKDAALAAITAAPAKLLGLEDRIGTIAAGRDADLVALSGDPFELTSKIRWTMIDGVIRAEEP
jgi:imidazolonepropionase-like amidohydrolase